MLLLVISLFTLGLAAVEPVREEGLSVHMLPDRVAKLSGKHGGFTVDRSKPALKTADEVITHLEGLPKKTQANGIWVVTTHPTSYSEEETQKLESLASLGSAKGIPVFTCRASGLPAGWQRISK
ncbi:hypothetical protein [Prosthecobacter sp. SYSU 5D2]|uniref:hypothetical protein n=1 Tax=Prosthecobacter sp. SYSU 5D2 TaxID=3134134 RepID=UPI0031FF1DD6